MKGRGCLSPEAIADVVRSSPTAEQEDHLRDCEVCSRRVTLVRRCADAGLARIAEAIGEVDARVEKLLAAPRTTWRALAASDELRRPDVGRRVLALAIDARLRDRSLSVDLAKVATTIADRLDGPDTADLRFEAWKFASAVLREAVRYAEAESAFGKAEEAARATSNPERAHASVLFARALLCIEPDYWKPEEAAMCLDQADRLIVGDSGRERVAQVIRGHLLYRSGNAGRACDVFASVLATTPPMDRVNYVDALNNWIAARIEANQTGEDLRIALDALVQESAISGRTIQLARAHWLLGKLQIHRGEYDDAHAVLHEARQAIQDPDAEIRIGLDEVHALVFARRYAEAHALAIELASATLTLDRREPSRRHTLTAEVFAYLREAAHREVLTPDLVAECGRYLDRLVRQPPRAFVPPMPLTEM